MAVHHDTIRLSNDLRIVITGKVSETIRQLVKAWATTWDEIAPEFAAAIADLMAIDPPNWPTRRQIARAERAQAALAHVLDELEGLTDFTGVLVTRAGSDATVRAIEWQEHLVRSQLPPSASVDTAAIMATWNRVPAYAVDAMVERLTEQITSTLRPLSAAAVDAMKRSLIRGVLVGDNPRQAAADMLARVEGDFNGGLTRALTIARTEILDAYRSGAAAAQFANADLLQGWQWLAELDSRTCPSCWAMHGSMHELTETGPNDHQNGRCARLPITKSWSDLGIDGVDEPPSVVQDAETVFHSLPRDEQLQIMGPMRLSAIDNGAPWSLLSVKQTNDGWRDSHVPTPARYLVNHAARAKRAAIRLV